MAMQLSDQVCLLDQAKKLKELGVLQESHFYHWKLFNGKRYLWGIDVFDDEDIVNTRYSAFTAPELGLMLTWDIVIARDISWNWIAMFQAHGLPESKAASFANKYLAHALTALLIYLIENGILKVEEINERLKG